MRLKEWKSPSCWWRSPFHSRPSSSSSTSSSLSSSLPSRLSFEIFVSFRLDSLLFEGRQDQLCSQVISSSISFPLTFLSGLLPSSTPSWRSCYCDQRRRRSSKRAKRGIKMLVGSSVSLWEKKRLKKYLSGTRRRVEATRDLKKESNFNNKRLHQ